MIVVFACAYAAVGMFWLGSMVELAEHLLAIRDLRREQQERRIDAWLREDAEAVKHEEGPHR